MLKYKEKRSPRPESGGGVLGDGAMNPLPTSYRVWGSTVSSPSGVRVEPQEI